MIAAQLGLCYCTAALGRAGLPCLGSCWCECVLVGVVFEQCAVLWPLLHSWILSGLVACIVLNIPQAGLFGVLTSVVHTRFGDSNVMGHPESVYRLQ